MEETTIRTVDNIGEGFIPPEFLPKGADEYYLRNAQLGKPASAWRPLTAREIEALVKNGNTCGDWSRILVAGQFDAGRVKNTEFYGLVRIGRIEPAVLEHHDVRVPVGISNSRIISCDIGDTCAIHDVRYLAHYIVGDRCLLLNIDEMHTTNHAKFGNGIVKDGEPEDVRVRLDLINEMGGRSIAPFDGMLPADAYLWAKFRDHDALQQRLTEITQKSFDSRRGYYGTVGECAVIKSCRIIKDVKIGPYCYVKGANKLKNLTINSSKDEPSQIGEGVELVNGIVGNGCHIFYGSKAVRFVMGNNANLKYGARLIHSYLGDNSTVSCCEMLYSLIFPAHEQHHNNSFLTAAVLLGQTNLAAGVTVGSNHNSRANDAEVQAGRGFWPGLCTTIKHSSRFASFTLLVKGDYPAELDISLPFCLVNNDPARDRLTLTPGYWWLYNMFALARNSTKYLSRDKRTHKLQHIEFDVFAPDSVEEIMRARTLLEQWTAEAYVTARAPRSREERRGGRGRMLLTGDPSAMDGLEVLGRDIERSDRTCVILKPREGYQAYENMLRYYAVTNLLAFLESDGSATFTSMRAAFDGPRETSWVNMGGQLVPEPDVMRLIADIESGKLATWKDIHGAYDALWDAYPRAKQRHAYGVLCALHGSELTREQWFGLLDQASAISEFIAEQVYVTRKKDYDNPFRTMTYRNAQEMKAVIGEVDANSFVKQVRKDTAQFKERVIAAKKRG